MTGTVKWDSTATPTNGSMGYDAQSGTLVIPVLDRYYILDPENGEQVNAFTEESVQWDSIRLCGQAARYDAILGQLTVNRSHAGQHLWHPPGDAVARCIDVDSERVRATSVGTGQLLWEFSPPSTDEGRTHKVISNVALVDSVGYVIASDARIWAFDLKTGDEIGWWQGPATVRQRHKEWRQNPIRDFGVTSDGKRLFVTFGDEMLYAFSR